MSNPAHLERMNNPFMDLPPEARPTRSPFDLRLMFNTLGGDSHRPFMQLMREISIWHMKSYNDPANAKDTDKLYALASAAGLDEIATEIARKWGVVDKDGPHRLPNCDSLRSWPEIESAAPQTLQIWLAHKQPNMMLGFFPLGGGESMRINQGGHTVMSEEGKVFKPGDWIGDLLVEYARLKIWRHEFGEETYTAPKPATTLPRPLAKIAPA